jgi:hypothetical protein
MAIETYRHFRYEIALGAAIPMPKPGFDYYPHDQYSLQRYLHTLCKKHVGSLGKREGKWSFGDDAPEGVRLSTNMEFMELLDFAEKMGIIVPSESEGGGGDFTPYKLSDTYWERFEKFAD